MYVIPEPVLVDGGVVDVVVDAGDVVVCTFVLVVVDGDGDGDVVIDIVCASDALLASVAC